jgi:hypothetical protein
MMILTILGLVLLLFPLVLITAAGKDRYTGWANALIVLIAFQSAVVFLLQILNVFTYPLVLVCNTAWICFLLYKKCHCEPCFSGRGNLLSIKKIDAGLIFVLLFSLFCLYQVHYNYNGKITDVKNDKYIEVEHYTYPYPYFSDEWYAIAFIEQSIKNHTLPFKNPFYVNVPFINLEFASHSFLSEIVLLLRLDPVTDYVKLTMAFNALIIVLIYLFLRYLKIAALTAGIAASATLFITDGSNLPGIWTLLPLTVGLVPLLLSFFYFEQRDMKMALFSVFMTLIMYPPLVVVITPALFIFAEGSLKAFLKYLLVAIMAAMLIGMMFLFTHQGFNEGFSYIASKLFYNSFTKSGVPDYAIWHVLPWPVIILALLAFFDRDHARRWLKVMAVTGLLFWFIYSVVMYRFVIDAERVIFFSAVMLIILSGIGLNQLIKYLPQSQQKFLQFGLLCIILFLSFHYTSREEWKYLTLQDHVLQKTFRPSSPANMFLTKDDLRIFKDIHARSFLSAPWKGTVIGVATDAYPRCTKEGAVTIDKDLYRTFMDSDCHGKEELAMTRGISYFYTPNFNCPRFMVKDRSSESLYLYEYQSK